MPVRLVFFLFLLLIAPVASAQYAETPRVLPVTDGTVHGGAQIGSRLFLGGRFTRIAEPTGGVAVFDLSGNRVPDAMPRIGGAVLAVTGDGAGGWFVAGRFERVADQPYAGLVHILPDGTLDPRLRVAADGAITTLAVGHGRLYVGGEFSSFNGAPRRRLAAIEFATGGLSSWGQGFDPGTTPTPIQLAVGGAGVYVGASRLWCLSATTGGALWSATGVAAMAVTPSQLFVSYGRTIAALDPLTGTRLPWVAALPLRPLSSTTGDYTHIGSLAVDGGTLYAAGIFQTTDGAHTSLVSLDVATGARLPWRVPVGLAGLYALKLLVLPAVVVVAHAGSGGPFDPLPPYVAAFSRSTGNLLPWHAALLGPALALGVSSDRVSVGGSFPGVAGVARTNLAAVDLGSGLLDPWTATVASGPTASVANMATDGTSLFVLVRDAPRGMLHKVDPVSGTALATLDLTGELFYSSLRVADGRLYLAGLFSAVGGAPRAGVASIDIDTWSVTPWSPTFDGGLPRHIEVAGDTAFLSGAFTSVGGIARDGLAAVDVVTGAVRPWNPSPDVAPDAIRVWNGRVLIAGRFRRVSGVRRRGLAALDPVTGGALPWNPDAPADINRRIVTFVVGPEGVLYADAPSAVVGGRTGGHAAAVSATTGKRLSWSLGDVFLQDMLALPDCLLLSIFFYEAIRGVPIGGYACLPPVPPPDPVSVTQTGSSVTLEWTAPTTPSASAFAIEVGSTSGLSNLGRLSVPGTQTSVGGSLPAGTYVARVRTVAGAIESRPSAEVSFAVGPPDVPPAPLDLHAATVGTGLTLTWLPPSTGAPLAYLIEAGRSAGAADAASITVPGSATSFTIDAAPGIYYARVRAVNAAGASAPSNDVYVDVDASAWVCGRPLGAPENLAVEVSGRTVALTWQQPYSGAVANTQRIVAGTAPGLDNLGAIGVPGPATSYRATVPPGTYYVRVVALDGCGASPFSNEVVVVVPK